MSYTYIASPYSGKDSSVREERFRQVRAYVAERMLAGEVAFSPIVHCHEVAIAHDMPTDFAFWEKYCLGMLEMADELVVLMLDGWEDSVGVAGEIEYAKQLGIPVWHEEAK